MINVLLHKSKGKPTLYSYEVRGELPTLEYLYGLMMREWFKPKKLQFKTMDEFKEYVSKHQCHLDEDGINAMILPIEHNVKLKQYAPVIGHKHDYVYCTKVNDNGVIKYYIGRHTTDNPNVDGYLGSSAKLKAYPREQVLERFDLWDFGDSDISKSYERALIEFSWAMLGKELVINERTSPSGGNYGEATNAKISQAQTINWQNNYDEKYKLMFNDVSNAKRVASKRKYNEENPLEFQEHMSKINNNPTKILNASNSNTGSKRTTEAKKNISKGIRNSEKRKDAFAKRKGNKPVTNIKDRYINHEEDPETYVLKDGEVWGRRYPKEAKIKGTRKLLYPTYPVTNMDTGDVYRVMLDLFDLLPNEERGTKPKLAEHIRQQKQKK